MRQGMDNPTWNQNSLLLSHGTVGVSDALVLQGEKEGANSEGAETSSFLPLFTSFIQSPNIF